MKNPTNKVEKLVEDLSRKFWRSYFRWNKVTREVHNAISKSRQMLQLAENWDGEGACPILESTWTHATQFLFRMAEALWKNYHVSVPSPDINPVSNGSIDIDWHLNGRELLINIPSDSDKPPTFYGDDGAGGKVGELHVSVFYSIFLDILRSISKKEAEMKNPIRLSSKLVKGRSESG